MFGNFARWNEPRREQHQDGLEIKKVDYQFIDRGSHPTTQTDSAFYSPSHEMVIPSESKHRINKLHIQVRQDLFSHGSDELQNIYCKIQCHVVKSGLDL